MLMPVRLLAPVLRELTLAGWLGSPMAARLRLVMVGQLWVLMVGRLLELVVHELLMMAGRLWLVTVGRLLELVVHELLTGLKRRAPGQTQVAPKTFSLSGVASFLLLLLIGLRWRGKEPLRVARIPAIA